MAGLALWAVAFAGELTADMQLEAFKQRPGTSGRTCRDGLWRYSRHPNYFFEWLIWCAFFLVALPAPWGATAVICPAMMLYFLFRVTGIPATEAQALRTRGEDYRKYQATTSVFVPWFPRRPGDIPGKE
jgi:steroid 5-alpha reductase family enzyme